MLYLDRICIAEIAKKDVFKSDIGISDEQVGVVLGAFFFTYALGQVPAGWLSDRFGTRKMLPLYIGIWSLCTILTGLANGFIMLMIARLLFGFSQAGCYPSAGSLIKRWVPIPQRGKASSVVSFGGRLGGAIAPLLTAWLLKDYLSWRAVLMLYGTTGFFVAIHFWRIYRETPSEHPLCNQEEQDLIAYGGNDAGNTGPPEFPPLLPLMQSYTTWLMCSLQFGINVGWVFLVTWLPRYLQDVLHVDEKTGGLMSTIILFAGIVGTLCGGMLADISVRHFGRRWGRSIPMICCYAIAVAAYLSCTRLESAWSFVIAASIVAFATDLSVPSIWAYMQDVGGKNTAAVFGWGNMWGNFGAATSPLLVPIVVDSEALNPDWTPAFYLFSLGYLVAGLCAIGINANDKIE